MSFDVYLVSFTDHEPSGVPRSLVKSAFGEHVLWEDEDSGHTQYFTHMDGCSIGLSPLDDDANLISSISINRPVADERFWDSIYQIMKLGNVALFFPGGKGPLIADGSVAAHLPPDISESLGMPIIVENGRRIVEIIESD